MIYDETAPLNRAYLCSGFIDLQASTAASSELSQPLSLT